MTKSYWLYARILRLWIDNEADCERRADLRPVVQWIAADRTLIWC